MWLVALLLILVGNCILFTLLFSNTREPLSYSQQGYLYSVALLRASSCPDVLPPSGERKIVHLRGRVRSVPPDSCWNTGEAQVSGMPLGTSLVVSKDLVVCGWGWPESLLNLRCAQVWPGRAAGVVLTAWHLVPSWDGVPAAAQALSSRSWGTKMDLGKSGASWFLKFFYFLKWESFC